MLKQWNKKNIYIHSKGTWIFISEAAWCQRCNVCVCVGVYVCVPCQQRLGPRRWWKGPHQGANEGWGVTGPQANSNEAAMWPAAGRAHQGRAKVSSWNTDNSGKPPLYCLSKYRNPSLCEHGAQEASLLKLGEQHLTYFIETAARMSLQYT